MPSLMGEKIEKVYLPSTAGAENEADKAWVLINKSVSAAATIGISEILSGTESTAVTLANLIKDWNLTLPDSEEKAVINAENLLHLPHGDFAFLSEMMADTMAAQKAGGIPEDLKGV